MLRWLFLAIFLLVLPHSCHAYLPRKSDIDKAWAATKKGQAMMSLMGFAVDVGMACSAAGAADDCAVKPSICAALRLGLDATVGRVVVFAGLTDAVLSEFCLGEPTLKCCRTLNDGDCHSAFNSPAPINCEGNPTYGPTETAGPCVRPCPGCAGCICNYLAACVTPIEDRRELFFLNDGDSAPTSEFTPVDNDHRLLQKSPFEEYPFDYIHLSRMNGFVDRVGVVLNQMNPNNPPADWTLIEGNGVTSNDTTVVSELLDFITFRGCTNFSENVVLLQDSIGTVIPADFRGDQVDRPGDIIDQYPAIRQHLHYFALARLALDIPQFWLRVDFINGNIWNEELRQSTLTENNISDPEADLLKLVDYGGLQLLKLSLSDNWPLILVPVNESLWQLDLSFEKTGGLLKCTKGNGRAEASQIQSFETIVDGADVTLTLELADKNVDFLAVRIYWGDGTPAEVDIVSDQVVPMITKTHSFESTCGDNHIIIQLTNKAGLRTIVRKTVDIVSCPAANTSPLMVDYPDVASVELQIDLTKGGNRFGDAGYQVFHFEGTEQDIPRSELVDWNATGIYSGMGDYANDDDSIAPSLLNMSFPWTGDPLRHFFFTCRTIDHYIYTSGIADLLQVRVRTISGDLIDVPFNYTGAIQCARRGNLFEDEQGRRLVSLRRASEGSLIEEGSGIEDELFRQEGFYFESFPGRYVYAASLGDTVVETETPSAAPTAGGGGGFFCFSGGSLVEDEERGSIAMHELQVGDRVYVGNDSFERVVAFGHKSDTIVGQYLKIFFDGGSLEISPDHMVFVSGHGFKPASEVIRGDHLTNPGDEKLLVVNRIEHVEKTGAYAPFTESGSIVVNGVVASNYVSFPVNIFGYEFESGHWIAHISQAPYRLVLLLGWCTEEVYSADGVSDWVMSTDSIDWLLEQNEFVFAIVFFPLYALSLLAHGMEHTIKLLLPA